MTSVKYWSAILSASQLTPLQDPHPASAAAVINGIVYCSSILPWATCGSEPAQPWRGSTLEAKTKGALESIKELLKDKRVVWGGDWNQNLSGGWEHVGSRGMQDAINSVLTSLGLRVVTSELPHRIQGSHTIDHIAVPADWTDFTAEKISAVGLSDHDLYCIEVPKTKIMRTMRSSEHLHDSENSQAEKSLTDADLLAMIDALTPEDQRRLEVVLQGALSGKLPEE